MEEETTNREGGGDRTKGGGGMRRGNKKQRGMGDSKTPRPKAPRARKHGTLVTTGAHEREKSEKEKKHSINQKTGQPKPGGGPANKERTETGHRNG